MRRAAVSVPANIAEGFSKRTIDKARFMNIAQGSLEELRYYFISRVILVHASRLGLDDVDDVASAGAYVMTLLSPISWLLTPDMSVIIIGAGHNGLTTAFYLARAGLKPLVLERRPMVGGGAITEEIAPGFHCPTLAHAIGPLRPSVVRDMRLAARGVEFIAPDPRLVSLCA